MVFYLNILLIKFYIAINLILVKIYLQLFSIIYNLLCFIKYHLYLLFNIYSNLYIYFN